MFLSHWLDGLRSRLFSQGFTGIAKRGPRRRRQGFALGYSSLASSVEILEVRALLSATVPYDGQTLIVAGTPNQTVQYHFDFTSHSSKTQNEVGIYVADDAQGHVGGLLPGAPGFAAAVLKSPKHQRLFGGSDREGTNVDLTFHGGDHVSFYLVQKGSAAQFLNSNSQNSLTKTMHVFFANPAANPDHFNHVQSQSVSSDSYLLEWNDQTNGGDRRFDHAVISFCLTQGPVYTVGGTAGQMVPVTFTLTDRQASYSNELGLIIVDDPLGKIGKLTPDNPGYAKAAFSAGRWKTVVPRGEPVGTTVTINLAAGTRFIFYGIQNATTATHITKNLNDGIGLPAPAFFGIPRANPDGQTQHLHYTRTGTIGFEDQTFGGDRDYNDLVVSFQLGGTQTGPKPVVTVSLANDTGSSSTDQLTSNPTVQGTVTGSSAITALEAAFDVGATSALGIVPAAGVTPVYRDITSKLTNGAFTLTSADLAAVLGSPLIDGNYRLLVRARDSAGQLSDTTSLAFTIDSSVVAPTAALANDTGSSSTDGLTSDPTVHGTATDSHGIVTLQAAFDTGTTPVFQDITGKLSGGAFTLTTSDLATLLGTPLTDGTFKLLVRDRDSAGNLSSNTALSFTLDTSVAAPTVTLTNDTGNSSTDGLTADPTVHGTATDSHGIVILQAAFDTGSAPVFQDITGKLSGGTFTLTTSDLATLLEAPLTDGTYRLLVRDQDSSGNLSSNTALTFTLDTSVAAPTAALANDTGNSSNDGLTSDPMIHGTATDSHGIVILQAAFDTGTQPVFQDITGKLSRGAFTLTTSDLATLLGTPLSDGAYKLLVRDRDSAGNLSTDTPFSFTFDTHSPSIMISSPTSGLLTNTNIQITGQVTDVLSGVASLAVQLDNGEFVNLPFDINNRFRFDTKLPLDGSNDGRHTVSIRATDLAGNVGLLSTVSFTLDTVAPVVPAFSLDAASDTAPVGDNQTTLATVTLTGHTEPNATVTLPPLGLSTVADDAGSFSFNGIALTLGTNPFTTLATDAAGNQSLFTQSITRVATDNLAGWVASTIGGSDSGQGGATLVGNDVVLREGDSLTVALSGKFTVPAAPSSVSFSYSHLNFDMTDQTGINDAFEAALVDADGNPLVQSIAPAREASFNISETDPVAMGANTLLVGQTVKFDLSHIPAGTTARLVVRLVNNDRDVNTNVEVSPFQITAETLGTPIGAVLQTAASTSAASAVPLDSLTDVSGSVRLDYGRTTLSENPEDLATEVQLTNGSSTVIQNHLILAFDHFSDPTISLVNPTGYLPDGRAYLDVSQDIPGGDLIQGESTQRIPLVFRDPNGIQFTYVATILASTNQAPTGFQSIPVKEIAVGTQYRYQAIATDPENQALVYSIVIGPQGMTIDPSSGLVVWSTESADVGNQSIQLRATDPYGLSVDQSFDLSVLQSLPNRPPVFTSQPPTDAIVAAPFEVRTYATGHDPSGATAADFGTGQVSIVTSNPGDQTLGLLGGTGQAGFAPTQPLGVGEPPPDTFKTSFVSPAPVDLGFSPNTYQNIERILGDVQTADVNGDGTPDLIVLAMTGPPNDFNPAVVGHIGIRLGNGDGTFRQGWETTLPPVQDRASSAYSVRFVDVTSDGKPDLVIAQYLGKTLLVYSGNGDGTFATTPIVSATGGAVSLIQTADFNRDGKTDIVLFESSPNGQFRHGLSVLFGDGNGHFGNEAYYPADNDNAGSGYAVDVDGVNGPDLVRLNATDDRLEVRLNDGTGHFGPVQYSTVFAFGNNGSGPMGHFVDSPITAYFGDFDHDGKIDAEVSTNTLGLFFLRGTGDGDFGDGTLTGNRANIPIYQPTGFDNSPAAYQNDGSAVDINGDGILDIVLGNAQTSQLFVGLGRGDGTFAQNFYNAQYLPDIGTGSAKGATPTYLVNVADYNRDGVMDVLIGSQRTGLKPGSVALILGDQPGTLRAVHVVPINTIVTPLFVTADFNNDGIPDLATTGDSIRTAIGNGDGTFAPFQAAIHVPAGGGEFLTGSLLSADFDHDGNMDLAWVGSAGAQGGAPPRYLQAFGLGNGTFQLASITNIPSAFTIGSTTQDGGVVGDFNGDGYVDLAYRVTDLSGTVTRIDVLLYDPIAKRFSLLPDATGLLGPIPRYSNFYRDENIGFADLNGDGKKELFVQSVAIPAQGNVPGLPERLTVYQISGAPAADAAQLFTRTVIENPGLSPNVNINAFAFGDFDHDGHLDIAAQVDNGTTVVAFGNGDFTFHSPTTYLTNGNTRVFAVDVTGDGILDLVCNYASFGNFSSRSSLTVLPGRADGTFGAAQQLAVTSGYDAQTLTVGDFNLDGKVDLATTGGSRTAEVFLSAPPGLADVASGDLNSDGRPDLVAINTGFNRVKIELSNGNGTFTRQADLVVGASPVALKLADVDQDGFVDIVTANRIGQSVTYLHNDGMGAFQRTDYVLPARPSRLALGDLNGDGTPDIVTVSELGQSLSVLPTTTAGIGSPITLNLGFAPGDVTLVDVTGDGKLDAVLTDPANRRVVILPGLGNGSFDTALFVGLNQAPARVAVGDLNADGKPDVIVTLPDVDQVGFLFNRGEGRFSTMQTISVGKGPSSLVVKDVNNDGRPDVLVTNGGDDTLSVILNRFDPASVYRYTPTAVDPDGDPVKFDLSQAPGGMLFDDATGQILWAPMPDQVGPNAVVIKASDGRGGEATQGFVIAAHTLSNTPPPVFTSTPTTVIAADGTYSYQVATTNPGGGPLRYSLVNGPEGMIVDPTTGAVSWDPREKGLSLDILRTDRQSPRFEGRGRIEVPDSPSLDSPSVTAEGWFKFDSNNSPANLLRKKFYDDNNGSPNIGTWALQNYYGTPRAIIGDSNNPTVSVSASTPFVTGVWYHVALTFDDATRTLSFYLNGQLIGSTVAPAALSYNSQPLQIGTIENLFGTVSGVRVWNVARSASEIAADMLKNIPSNSPGLVLDYRFNEGPDSASVVDSTANLNNGGISTDYEFYNYPPRVPTLGYEGSYPVTLRVEDGRGGVALQTFNVDIVSPVRGSVSGTVFNDRNGDGQPSTGEPGLAGWTVFVDTNQNGNQDFGELSTTTNATGTYTLTGLAASTVTIAVLPRAGAATPQPRSVAIPAGSTASADFAIELAKPGLIRGKVNVAGTGTPIRGFDVYADTNHNGRRDDNEPFSATDSTGHYVLSDLSQGDYTIRLDAPPGWNVSTPSSGSYLISLPANGDVSGEDFVAAPQNQAAAGPVFVTMPQTVATARKDYRYAPIAADPLGQPVTFALAAAPDGMAVDPVSGVVAWTPTVGQLGANRVLLRASNPTGGVAVQDFTIVVAAPNTAPMIASTPPSTAFVGIPFRYQVAAQDAEQSVLEFVLDQAPAGMTIDATSGLVNWTPDSTQSGAQSAVIVVHDGVGGEVRQTVSLMVTAAGANGPPSIVSAARLTAQVGTPYRGKVVATDPDGDPLVFSVVTGPTGLSISSDGILAWTPTPAQFGQNSFRIRVSDGRSFDEHDFAIDVRSFVENTAPNLSSTDPAFAVVDRLFAVDLHATDANGDPIAFTLLNGPIGLSVDATRGTVRWIPAADQVGSQSFVVRVVDPFGGFDMQTFTINVRGSGGPPAINSIPPTVAAVGQTYLYTVSAMDVEGDPLTYSLLNPLPGMAIDAVTGVMTWTPVTGQIGSNPVIVRVANGAGGFNTQAFSISVSAGATNRPPVIHSVPPFEAVVGTPFVYTVQASDPEGETLTYAVQAGPTNVFVDPATGVVNWTPTTDNLGRIVLVLTATDPGGASAVQSFEVNVAASNHPPRITSVAPASVPAGGLYRYDVLADDPDHEPLSYELVSGPAGMVIDSLGHVRWQTALNTTLGDRTATVVVRDGRGGSVTQNFTLTVKPDTTPPRVSILIANGTLYPWSTDPARVRISATDDVGVADIAVTVDGQPVALGSDGTFSVYFSAPGGGRVEAFATDAAGNRGRGLAQVRMRSGTEDGSGNLSNVPTLAITSVADGDQLQGFVKVVGSAVSQDLSEYVVSYRQADEVSFHEISRGSTSVDNGLLGTWDTTLLENDNYVLRLEATDQFGNFVEVERQVSVVGNFKLGNFRLSFNDITIPVAGIPISLIRTYDALQADRTSDLGYGWTLDFRNTNLQTSLPKSGLEDLGIYTPFKEGAKVYVTLPGGTREGYTFTPDIRVLPGFGSNLVIATPRFTPDRGVKDTLTVSGGTFIVNQFGELMGGGGQPYNPAAEEFGGGYTVTTPDGIAFKIDGQTGLLNSVRDRNNNTLTFSDAGVSGSGGESLTFERDPQGRVTKVIDPSGKSVNYAYDFKGDLVSVTDREGNLTRFVYKATPAHYLDTVIDPQGHNGARTNYDANGRLIATTDGNGVTRTIAYDPANQLVTTTDPLGKPATDVYDNRGNVLSTTDALGRTRSYTYDDANHVLSTTDPAGNTTVSTFDSAGNETSRTDPSGNTRRWTYGAFGTMLSSTDALGNTVVMTYDDHGNQLTYTDPLGNVTKYQYDTRGLVTDMIDPAGFHTSYTYDDAGYRNSVTTADGTVTHITSDALGDPTGVSVVITTAGGPRTLTLSASYDANGQIRSFTDAEGNTSTRTYNANGQPATDTDALGRTTTYQYDANGNSTGMVLPNGSTIDKVLNDAGQAVKTTIPGGMSFQNLYDAAGFPTGMVNPDGSQLTVTYDSAGRPNSQTGPSGGTVTRKFDAQNRVISTTDAAGNVTSNVYDAAGQITSTTDGLGRTTQFRYDAAGEVVATIAPNGGITQFGYDSRGNRTSETNPLGQTTRYQYDSRSRLIAVEDAAGGITSYTYNEVGSLLSQTDADGRTTRYEYDGRGLRTAVVTPLGERSTYEYDAAGQLVRKTNAAGESITYTYTSLGQLATKTLPGGDRTTYAYRASGNPETITDSRGTTRYLYDSNENLMSVIQPDGRTISYTTNSSGEVLTLTTASGTTTYTPDRANRLTSVTDADGGLVSYHYDAGGQITQTDRPDGTTEMRAYNSLGNVTRVLTTSGITTLSDLTYEYDLLGQEISFTEVGVAKTTYTYDPLGRLLMETRTPVVGGMSQIRYTYDAVGNRTSMTTAAGATNYTYNADNELIGTSGVTTATYTYDAAGRLILRDGGPTDRTAYQWNAENRLVRTDTTTATGTTTITQVYDSAGILVSKTVNGVETRYLNSSDLKLPVVVEEYTAAGVATASYSYGYDIESRKTSEGRLYYHADADGNVLYLTDGAHSVVATSSYTAYGVPTTTSGIAQPYQFEAEPYDPATGLIYLRARHYDPATGRFLSPDPFSGTLASPISRQKYLYGNDTPTNASDPTGMLTLSEELTTTFIQSVLAGATVQVVIGALLSIKGINGWSGPNFFDSAFGLFAGFGLYTTRNDSPSNIDSKRSTIATFAAGKSVGVSVSPAEWAKGKYKNKTGVDLGNNIEINTLGQLGLAGILGFNYVVSSETLFTPGVFGSGNWASAAVLGAYLAVNGNFSSGIAAFPYAVRKAINKIFDGNANAFGAQISSEGFSLGFSFINTQSDLQLGASFSISAGFSAGWVIDVNQPYDRKSVTDPPLFNQPFHK